MSPALFGLLAIAGGVGAVLRFVVDGAVRDLVGGRWPWGTAAINVSGSFLLGLLTGLTTHGMPPAVLLVAGTGLLGGYTTFSTASVETVRLLQQGRVAASAVYALAVPVVAIVAALLGLAIGG